VIGPPEEHTGGYSGVHGRRSERFVASVASAAWEARPAVVGESVVAAAAETVVAARPARLVESLVVHLVALHTPGERERIQPASRQSDQTDCSPRSCGPIEGHSRCLNGH
jgi:hypothetical protein